MANELVEMRLDKEQIKRQAEALVATLKEGSDGNALADFEAVISVLNWIAFETFRVVCVDCRRRIRKQARTKVADALERARVLAERDVKAGKATREHLN
jgi:hypothetical protein